MGGSQKKWGLPKFEPSEIDAEGDPGGGEVGGWS
jgi:hypothetical protein